MNPDKRELTYTLGDTPFGQALATQSSQPSGDKKSGGRRHHRPARKDRPMPHTQSQTHDDVSTPVTPAGGKAKREELVQKAMSAGKETVGFTLKVSFATAISALTYWGLKRLGVPLP